MAEGSLKLSQLGRLGLLGKSRPQQPIQLPEKPRLGDKIELIGEMTESAFKDPQWLISRDGRFIQVTELVYRIAEQVDGQRNVQEIAAAASSNYEREITPQETGELIAGTLIPVGIVLKADGTPAVQSKSGPSALQVNLKMKMLSPTAISLITGILKLFYFPPVLIAMLVAAAATQYWVFFVHGLGSGLHETLNTPGMLVPMMAIILAAAVFHEFGHASALTYGGGKVGGMGAGLYIVYPALYTDVTDNYRLPRWSRVRTDLGGFYFNLIFSLALTGLYFLTGKEFLLLAVAVIDIEIIHQILPFVRLDGYWALADVTGIPDFFSQIGPFLRSVLPSWVPFPKGRQLAPLKPWAKAFFIGYILIVGPLLIALFFLLFRALPRILATAGQAFWDNGRKLPEAFAGGDILLGLAIVVQLILLLLPGIGAVYVFFKLMKRFVTGVWKWSEGSASKRLAGTGAYAGVAALLLFLWLPQINIGGLRTPSGGAVSAARPSWEPIAAGERFTAFDAAQQRVVTLRSDGTTEQRPADTTAPFRQGAPAGENVSPSSGGGTPSGGGPATGGSPSSPGGPSAGPNSAPGSVPGQPGVPTQRPAQQSTPPGQPTSPVQPTARPAQPTPATQPTAAPPRPVSTP